MSRQKLCPRCQAPAPIDAPACLRAGCGHQFRTQFAPEPTQLLQPSPFEPPLPIPATPFPKTYDDRAVGGLVLGVLALLLPYGAVFGAFSIFFGVVALRQIPRNPRYKGLALAWVGIALSTVPVGYVLYRFAVFFVSAVQLVIIAVQASR